MKAIIKQSRPGDLYQTIELVEESGEKTKISVSAIDIEIRGYADCGNIIRVGVNDLEMYYYAAKKMEQAINIASDLAGFIKNEGVVY